MQLSGVFDVFARVEPGLDRFRSVIHNPSARAVAISAMDKELDAAMQLLLTLRNALAPISLLPPEVLALIFHFLSFEEPPCSGKQNLGWIRATHVCHFWRHVALGDSSLWARISGRPTNLKLISGMLARTRTAPLDIDIDLDGTLLRELVLLMLHRHLSHTRKLRLRTATSLHFDSFRRIYSQEAPVLEHFELDSFNSPIIFRELGGMTLFKGQAPSLRSLVLTHVFIPWSLIPRGQLTRLEISLVDVYEISIADIPLLGDLNQLIDLLVNCPELEVLALDSCLPSQLVHFPYGQTIHLPHLSRLTLGGSSPRISNLLKILKIPSSTMLHLYCTFENASTYDDHDLLLPVVSAHFRSSAPIEFKNLRVTLNSTDRLFEVTGLTFLPTSRIHQSQSVGCGMDDDDNDDEFILSFEELPEVGHWTDIIERVCKMLPISNIEFLSISASNIINIVNWVELFKRCTKITTMQAIGRGTSGLVRALTTPKVANTRRGVKWKTKRRDNGDSSPAQPAKRTASWAHAQSFPKLKFLSLKRLDFNENEYSSRTLFDVVHQGLRQRMEVNGAPLEMLCIDSCAISAKRAKALQNLVQRFHWDREEGFSDDELEFGGSEGLWSGSWWEVFFEGVMYSK